MSSLTYRPALDGVRCVAVVAVLVYHLDREWLPGGFLGVDVFFVLSGYLITSLLLAERASTGRIALPAFWSRRARRLLPCSLLAITSVAVWLSSQNAFVQANRRGDLVAALFDVANWRLIITGESYFEAFTQPSPVRHFWSLAIEEQFYLLWPLLCVVALGFGRRTLAIIAAALAVASSLWCAVAYEPGDPSRAYYGTDTRVHQLLVGCLLAMAFAGLRGRRWWAVLERPERRAVPVAALAALVALGVLIATVGDRSAWYYRGGSVLVAVVAAVLIAAVELRPASAVGRVLGAPAAAAVGRVSYGLYVWHWPIYVWMPPGTWSLAAGLPISLARLAVTAGVAFVSYRLVEQPIRRARSGAVTRPAAVATGSVLSIGAVLTIVLAVTWGAHAPAWAQAAGNEGAVVATGAGSGPVVAVVGDSVAASLVPGLVEPAAARGWELFDGTRRGCPLTGLPQALDDGTVMTAQNAECAEAVPRLHQLVMAAAPDVIVWHDLQAGLDMVTPSGEIVDAGQPAWRRAVLDGWAATYDSFVAAGAQVLLIVPPWRSPAATGACSSGSFQERCREIEAQDLAVRAATEEFVEQHAGDPRLHVLDIDAIVCPGGPPCPATVDGLELRELGRDRTHLTPDGARVVGARVADEIAALLG